MYRKEKGKNERKKKGKRDQRLFFSSAGSVNVIRKRTSQNKSGQVRTSCKGQSDKHKQAVVHSSEPVVQGTTGWQQRENGRRKKR